MAHTIFRAGRLAVIALAAYLATGCGVTTDGQNAWKTGLSAVETPSAERLAKVQLRVARTAFRHGNLETALDLFANAHQTAPDAAAPLVGTGDVRFAERRFGAAETSYRAALARDPSSFDAHEGLGKTLVTLKKYQEGLRSFDAARAIRPDAALLNKIGVTHELLGDGRKAQKNFRAALALDPKSLTARNNLALSLAVSGDYAAALGEMERVVSSPKSSERHHANLAFIYGLAGRSIDQAPAQVSQAAVNKGWDERFFARTRAIARAGDRAAILDLLSSHGPRGVTPPDMPDMAQLPEMPDVADVPDITQLPEMPDVPETPEIAQNSANRPAPVLAPTAMERARPAIAPPIAVSPPSAAAAMVQGVDDGAARQEPVIAAILPVSPDPAAVTPTTEPPMANDMAATNLLVRRQQTSVAAREAPAPAPADTTARETPTPQPAPRIARRGPAATAPAARLDMPATPATPSTAPAGAATAGGAYRAQIGAYPTRWLGRALATLGKAVGGLLPANRVEVVRGSKYHTLRTTGIAGLDVARRLCITLRSRRVDCFVTRQVNPPAGQGIDIATASDRDAMALFLASVAPIEPAAAQSDGAPETPTATPRPSAPATVAAIAAGPSTARPARPGEYRVQFAAYRRAEHLDRGLKVLRAKAGDLLPALEALVRSGPVGKTLIPYRLRSAPMASRMAAAALCQSLSAKGIECLVIRHGPRSWRRLG